jgi:hypothetical protein
MCAGLGRALFGDDLNEDHAVLILVAALLLLFIFIIVVCMCCCVCRQRRHDKMVTGGH